MKVLQEVWTEYYPSGAYWNPTRVIKDNRIMPYEEDKINFTFSMDDAATANVTVRLLFRRATKELMDQKGWDVQDLPMEELHLILEK